jgi:hypothetical protein
MRKAGPACSGHLPYDYGVGRGRPRRYLPTNSAAAAKGSTSIDHHSNCERDCCGRGDRGWATPSSIGDAGDAVAGLRGESVLDALAQPVPLGRAEPSPVPVELNEVGASVPQPPSGVADGVRDGVLDGVLVRGRVLAAVAEEGAVVVRAALGGTLPPPELLEPFRVMSELPLLWYPSVARIM